MEFTNGGKKGFIYAYNTCPIVMAERTIWKIQEFVMFAEKNCRFQFRDVCLRKYHTSRIAFYLVVEFVDGTLFL